MGKMPTQLVANVKVTSREPWGAKPSRLHSPPPTGEIIGAEFLQGTREMRNGTGSRSGWPQLWRLPLASALISDRNVCVDRDVSHLSRNHLSDHV